MKRKKRLRTASTASVRDNQPERAIADPAAPYLALASMYEASNEPEKAYAALEEGLKRAPARPDFLRSLALMAGKIDRPRDGLRWARRLLAEGDQSGQLQARDLIAIYKSWLSVEMTHGKPQRISACMIVKNESENLPRILMSLQGAVDEVIVVDTGSTDETVAIARNFGARVHAFEWCDDFAAARNESLKHATGDWIIWVDGDDELVEREPRALRRLCQDAPPGVADYWVDCHNLRSRDGDVGNVIQQWRLFRSGRGVAFHGRIHECLALPGHTPPLKMPRQDAVLVRHWGYIPSQGLIQRKSERNLPLLNAALAEEPQNPYHSYNLGQEYIWQDQPVAALSHLERAIELWNKDGRRNLTYIGSMFALAIRAAVRAGAYERALELEAIVPQELMSSEILCETANACIHLHRLDEGQDRLERAWTDPQMRNAAERDPAAATWKPRLLLAELHLKSGQRQEAYDLVKTAMDSMPLKPEIVLEWAALAMGCGQPDEAVRWLRKLLDSEHEQSKPQARRLLLNIAAAENDGLAMLEALSGPVDGLSGAEALRLGAQALQMTIAANVAPSVTHPNTVPEPAFITERPRMVSTSVIAKHDVPAESVSA